MPWSELVRPGNAAGPGARVLGRDGCAATIPLPATLCQMSGTRSAREAATWTLGRREGQDCWYCVYCGRNCLADGLSFVHMERLDDGPQIFACECCFRPGCIHRRPILIECEQCRRPVARLTFGGGAVTLIGNITPEGQMRGGMSTENRPKWRARIWDVSPGGALWDTDRSGGVERFKLVCVGRRHRIERAVTRPALQSAYVAARRDGRIVIQLRDLQIGHRTPPLTNH